MKVNKKQLRILIRSALLKEGFFSNIGTGIGKMFGYDQPGDESIQTEATYMFTASIPFLSSRGEDPAYPRHHALNKLSPNEKIAKARRFTELLSLKLDMINIKLNPNIAKRNVHSLPVFTKASLDKSGTMLLLHTNKNQFGFDKFGVTYLKDINSAAYAKFPLATRIAAPWEYEAFMTELGVQDPDVAQIGEALLRVLRFRDNKKLQSWRPSYM